MPAVSQSTFIAVTVLAAFVVFIAARNELTTYLQLLL